ncbi:MAG: cysteine desulfurase [Deltaproteobacteria bacterium]|nr:cysteine desulfurase [Deltaproteobacteria bacterium]
MGRVNNHSAAGVTALGWDVWNIRRDFPILKQKIHGKPLIYLDNAATAQKPHQVIEAVNRFYLEDCSNIHRGVHTLSERATKAYENAREKVRQFINAKSNKEIIFVRGATEAINLVAQAFGRTTVGAMDEIVLSSMEHHSNIVPWQMLCEEKGAHLRVIPMNEEGDLNLDKVNLPFNERTKLVALTHVSNAIGTINPIRKVIEAAHLRNIPVLIDGAQSAPHFRVDVQQLGCDFYVFSGHKLYGPTGVGVLYGKQSLLERMPPYQGGGDMIRSVTFEKTVFNELPYKFEAGTPNISGVTGLGAAIDYVHSVGLEQIEPYERSLTQYALEQLATYPWIRLIGRPRERVSVISFVVDGIHPHDVGTILDQEGIAIRTGHHCAQPVMEHFGLSATCRLSLAFYNTREEIDALVGALKKAREVFSNDGA